MTDCPAPLPYHQGEVVYIYAFDLAYDMKRQPLSQLLGQPTRDYEIGSSKRNPKQLFFYKPQMVTLPPVVQAGSDLPGPIRRSVKLFSVGAMSLQIRVPFAQESLESLVRYHGLHINQESIDQQAQGLAEQVLEEVRPHCIRPVAQLGPAEQYTVFCLKAPAEDPSCWQAEQWLEHNRRAVAGLLTEEPDSTDLSDQETMETTRPSLSYYQNDLVLPDWDAGLVIADPGSVEDILHIMEVANVQLLELETYDRTLDGALERAYRDLGRPRLRPTDQIQKDLREIRVDMARFSDELLNITKFFGDWHLARIYQHVAVRFHLADWFKTTDEKLKTLAELYQLLQHDRFNGTMMILEIAIVVLFILDLVFLFMGK